jgi:hypothetical protein
MILSKSFGNEIVDRVLEAMTACSPERDVDHGSVGPARFWADPPPGRDRIAA